MFKDRCPGHGEAGIFLQGMADICGNPAGFWKDT